MLDRDKDVKMAKKQLKIIGYGGIISALFRFSETIGSHLLIKLSDDYVWHDDLYFVPLSNGVAAFLFYKTLVNLIATLMLFYVVYYIPARSGKVQKINLIENDITFNR